MPPDPSPIAIGGVGGSGTRLIARSVQALGYFMGGDLNPALDNLWFTLLFKRPEALHESAHGFDRLLSIFVCRMTGRGALSLEQVAMVRALGARDRLQHPRLWLELRVKSLLGATEWLPTNAPWGWKEPNTHIHLDRLLKRIPRLRYIHVVRNGLDVACSNNQNQLALWGPHFLGPECQNNPRWALKYWVRTQQRVVEIGRAMGGRFLLLDFDKYCTHPEPGARRLMSFLGLDVDDDRLLELKTLVRAPPTIGRFKQVGIGAFDAEDVETVRSWGFDTTMD